jgi:hypothetical protein
VDSENHREKTQGIPGIGTNEPWLIVTLNAEIFNGMILRWRLMLILLIAV